MLQYLQDAPGQRFVVANRDEGAEAAIVQNLTGTAGAVGGNRRCAKGQRLNQGDPQPLPTGAEYKGIRGTQMTIGIIAKSGQVNIL
jgi:hypothetical protein